MTSSHLPPGTASLTARQANADSRLPDGRGRKRTLPALCCAAILLAAALALPPQRAVAADAQSPAADDSAGGGFSGPSESYRPDTAARAMHARDGSEIELVGYLVSRIQEYASTYLFRDGTGEMLVTIHGGLFVGRTVSTTTRVRVRGTLDRKDTPMPRVIVASLDFAPLPNLQGIIR